MNLKHLLPAALFAMALSASAVPAYPGYLERTLEDGSKVMVRLNGDEYFSYLTDEQGYLLTDEGGKLNYMHQEGARLKASPEAIERMRAQAEATLPTKQLRAAEMQRMASLTREGRTTFCTTGDVHFCVLLVQYQDIKFNSATIREDMNDMLNKEGYDKNGCKGSVRDYYIMNSNGNFRPTFDVSEVITLPQTSMYYTGGHKYDKVSEMVRDAVQLADPTVDFTKYCNVSPGQCDAVILWYAGYGQADTQQNAFIWPHQSNVARTGISADGIEIGVYCCFNELNGGSHYYYKDGAMAGLGTPIHEFGHVMGMPDLYDPNYEVKSTPGQWSIFDMGSYLGDGYCPPSCSGYERWIFNWTEYEEVVEGTHYDLANINEAGRVLRIPVKNKQGVEYAKEYFLLESRHKDHWDTYLPGQGMLIWHIDYDQGSWAVNSVNSNENRKRCHLITADGSANFFLGNKNASSNDAAWPYKRNYITPDTEITLNTAYPLAASRTGESYITDIAYNAETGVTSFDYNVYTESPTEVTVMNTPTRGLNDREQPNSDITFTWEPVEGATEYQLTVYRKSGNNIYYESGLNEENVGNRTSYTIESLSRNKMDLEFNAYVRVVKGLPSVEKSNEVVFVPKNLEAVSGIEESFTDDVQVLGLNGYIQAPENAEIYNMQGVRCNAYGLAPGVYIVRTGSDVTKVIVK